MSTNFYKISADPKKELDGIWVQIEDALFCIRRAGGANVAYKDALAKALQEWQRKRGQFDQMPFATQTKVDIDVFSRHVFLEWKNVLDEHDAPLASTPANFVKLMNDLPDLWAHLQREADRIENFRAAVAQRLGEDLGNASRGTGNGATDLIQ